MYTSQILTKVKLSLLITLLLMVAIYLFWGFYYAWVDDIWQNLFFRGIILPSPHGDIEPVQLFFSRILAFLYTYNASIPFYGIMHYMLLYISLANVTYILLATIKKPINKNHLFVIVLFLFCFSSELIVAYSFVQTTILLLFSACFAILVKTKHSKTGLVYWFVCIISASFFRIDTLMLGGLLICLFALYFVISGTFREKSKSVIMLTIFIVIGALSSHYYFESVEDDYMKKAWADADFALNAFDYNYTSHDILTKANHRDSVAINSLREVVMADSNIYSPSIVRKISIESPLQTFVENGLKLKPNNISSSFLLERFHYLIAKSEKFKGTYFYTYNFGYLSLVYLFLSIIFCLTFIKRNRWKVLLMVLLYWLSIFSIGLVYKMEFYAYKPMALFIFLFLLLEYFDDSELKYSNKRFLVLSFVFVSFFECIRLTDLKKDLNKRDSDHYLFQEKINTLNERYVFIDIFSSGLLHGTPFHDLPVKSNKHILVFYPEAPLCFCNFYTQALLGKAPSYSLTDFYDFVIKHRSESVFLYAGRVGPYNEILQEYYNKGLRFTPKLLFYQSHGMTEPNNCIITEYHIHKQ